MSYAKSIQSIYMSILVSRCVILLVAVLLGTTSMQGQSVRTESQSTSTMIGIDRLQGAPDHEAYQHLFVPPDLCTNINFSLQSIVVDVVINDITHPNNPDCAGLDLSLIHI